MLAGRIRLRLFYELECVVHSISALKIGERAGDTRETLERVSPELKAMHASPTIGTSLSRRNIHRAIAIINDFSSRCTFSILETCRVIADEIKYVFFQLSLHAIYFSIVVG